MNKALNALRRVREWLTNWRILVICLGGIFGIFSILASLLFYVSPSYKGVHMLPYDAEVHYAARVRDVMDGHPGLGSVFLPEKNLPSLQPSLPEIVIGTVGLGLGLSAVEVLLLTSFLFGAAVYVIMVFFFEEVISDRRAALLGVTFVMFLGFLPGNVSWLLGLVQGNILPVEGGLPFGRPINPQWSVFWVALAMWGMVRWLKRKDVRMLWLTAACFVVLVYSYIYAWTVVAVLGAMTVLLSWRSIKALPWKQVGSLLILGVIALLPYAAHLHKLISHPLYEATSKRLGIIATHRPEFSVTVAVLVVVLILLWKRTQAYWMYIAAIAVTWVIVINQQVITGQLIQIGHYDWYFIKPFSIGICVALIASWGYARTWTVRHQRVIKMVTGLCILMAVVIGGVYQIADFSTQRPIWAAEQKAAGVLHFLSRNGMAEEVVFAPRSVADQIVVYTDKNTYISSNHVGYLISTQNLADRYFFEQWIKNPSWSPDWLSKDFRCELSSRLYTHHFIHARGNCDAFTETERETWIQAFKEFSALPTSDKMTLHQLDYLVVPTMEPIDPILTPYVKEVYKDDAYIVYDVI